MRLPMPGEELLPSGQRPRQLSAAFTIGRDGSLSAIELPASVQPEGLRRWIESHLQDWRFFPELRNDEPVERRVKPPFTLQ